MQIRQRETARVFDADLKKLARAIRELADRAVKHNFRFATPVVEQSGVEAGKGRRKRMVQFGRQSQRCSHASQHDPDNP